MINQSVDSLTGLKKMAGAFFPYAEKQLGFDQPVDIIFQSDADNAQNILGKTAQYDPDQMSVTLFTDGRHPKDVLRSLSHELVHHTQNCRGDFDSIGDMDTSLGYAQRDGHLRGMEEEAYKLGNLIFRDWEDMFKQKAVQLQERKLRRTVRKGLKKMLNEATTRRSLKEAATASSWKQAREQDPAGSYTAADLASAGKYTDPKSDAWRKGTYGGKGRYITGPNASEDLKQYLGDIKDIEAGTDIMDILSPFYGAAHPSEIPRAALEMVADAVLGGAALKGIGKGAKALYKAAPFTTSAVAGAGLGLAGIGAKKHFDKYSSELGQPDEADRAQQDAILRKLSGPGAESKIESQPSSLGVPTAFEESTMGPGSGATTFNQRHTYEKYVEAVEKDPANYLAPAGSPPGWLPEKMLTKKQWSDRKYARPEFYERSEYMDIASGRKSTEDIRRERIARGASPKWGTGTMRDRGFGRNASSPREIMQRKDRPQTDAEEYAELKKKYPHYTFPQYRHLDPDARKHWPEGYVYRFDQQARKWKLVPK